jgi:hypothetical protein
LPVHTIPFEGFEEIDSVGFEFTVTTDVAVDVHPLFPVPVTVYVNDEPGINGTPSVIPPDHE